MARVKFATWTVSLATNPDAAMTPRVMQVRSLTTPLTIGVALTSVIGIVSSEACCVVTK